MKLEMPCGPDALSVPAVTTKISPTPAFVMKTFAPLRR